MRLIHNLLPLFCLIASMTPIFVISPTCYATTSRQQPIEELACSLLLSTKKQKVSTVRETWQTLSEVKVSDHDPDRYRYLIHTIGNRVFAKDVLQEISEIANRNPLSMSLVDETNTLTFWGSTLGFILSVPPENILATSVEDMGGVSNEEVFSNYGISSPDKLIQDSLNFRSKLRQKFNTDSHNEVRAQGTVLVPSGRGNRKKSKIQVIGLFYFESPRGPRATPDILRRFRAISRQLNLPLIRLTHRFVSQKS